MLASNHFLQSYASLQLIVITSLQCFESGQALFLVVLIFASYPQPFFPLSSVPEAVFALSFPFLSERFFFVMLKLLLLVVEINNTGVKGQVLLPKSDFEHART